MPLTFKPHAWLARLPDPESPGEYRDGVEVRGRIKQVEPSEAIATFGDPAGAIARPFIALCDVPDAAKHLEGGLIEWEGRRFSIELPPLVNPATSECSYAKVMLSELVD